MSESESKRPKDNAFYQQRLKYWQPLFIPKNVIITFSLIGILFIIIGIPIVIASNQIVEYKVTYDGNDISDSSCKIQANNEHKKCTITFSIDKEMKAPVHMYYELNNFYQNHRLYVNSRDDDQLRGKEVSISTLESNCGNKTYDGELILNPCGSIANSFFNDVFTVAEEEFELNERDISWKYDREKYKNPMEYNEGKYKYLYQSYPDIIPKEGIDDPKSASYYGGGVENEHFIVWMRAAALPRFRKLYGRIEKDIPAGTQLRVNVDANYYVPYSDKSLILTTTNWLGGRNHFLGVAYITVGVICIIFAIVFIIKQLTCPRKLGDIKYLKVDWFVC